MRIGSISDLHLGPSSRRERFRQSEAELIALSEHLAATHDRVVLLGDIYQSDYGWRLGSDPTVRSLIERRYSRLTDLWRDPVFQWLPGNHDDLDGDRELEFGENGIRAWYHHGQDVDPYCKGWSQRLTMWSVARTRSAGWRRASDWFERNVLERGHRFLAGGIDLGQQRVAVDAFESGRAHIVVMGHTHLACCLQTGGGVYLNSGVCSADHPWYASVDITSGQSSLYAFREGLPELQAQATSGGLESWEFWDRGE